MVTKTRLLKVVGQVQGVGFRPFVFRLAKLLDLNGQVQNCKGVVEIFVQGSSINLNKFAEQLIQKSPPLAKPEILENFILDYKAFADFKISSSSDQGQSDIHVPPDFFTCDDCLTELNDPAEKRFRYPFINCTQCGPRYSIIKSLPYDRVNTTMHDFELCTDCSDDYSNPLDRRFHAQPLACGDCGPELTFLSDDELLNGNEASLKASVQAISSGKIVAVKGVGGYHLICDALNDEAVQKLRQRKHRPEKPLAVMFPMTGDNGLRCLNKFVSPSLYEEEQIIQPTRCIVLVTKNEFSSLSKYIAPGLNEIGVFLPYSPLHHLLLNELHSPVVATSGNISGEPVLTNNIEAEKKLGRIADCFLHHNRKIQRPADDSVIRVINQKARTIRLGRGLAPYEINLSTRLKKPIIAVGGHMKVTVALAWEKRCVISPHISDLDTLRGVQVFDQLITDLQRLYGVKAEKIICDAHSGYASHQWAIKQTLKMEMIYHHHAHAGVLAGSYPEIREWLCFCWDGVGLGEDDTIWGGEAFTGSAANWKRVASFKSFYLPGGDKAGRQPWRSEAALRWEKNEQWMPDIDHAELAFSAWKKKINSPQSSAAGRLFDAAASIILGKTHVSFEGQGPMMLEAISDEFETDYIEMELLESDNGILRSDWSALLPMLTDQSISVATRAAVFHNSMALALIHQALAIRKFYDFEAIGLSGGVFQNRLLTEKVMLFAKKYDFKILMPELIPVNDGGLSFGQVIEYSNK